MLLAAGKGLRGAPVFHRRCIRWLDQTGDGHRWYAAAPQESLRLEFPLGSLKHLIRSRLVEVGHQFAIR